MEEEGKGTGNLLWLYERGYIDAFSPNSLLHYLRYFLILDELELLDLGLSNFYCVDH